MDVLPWLVLGVFATILVATCVALLGADDDRPYRDEDVPDENESRPNGRSRS